MKKCNKRTHGMVRIAAAAALMMTAALAFAGSAMAAPATTPEPISAAITTDAAKPGSSFKLNSSYPYDGDKNVPVDTVGIKLYFDANVTDASVREINSKAFTFSGGKSEKITTKAYFDKDDAGYILVTATKMKDDKAISLNPASKYKLTISKDLAAVGGSTLGEDTVINFNTVDTSGNTKVYMLLMVLMVAGMIAMTFISNKRKAKAKAEAANTKAVNPYKLAKEKGITVQEAMAIVERDKQKREKRLKAAGIDPKSIAAPKDEGPKGHKVKGPRPISAGGSTYKTGRKAIAEKEAAARRAKGTTNPKSKKGKKGKKR